MRLAGKYTFIILIASVLIMTPVLQGNQIAVNADESSECCGCCCGCGESDSERNPGNNGDNGCGCQMTDSEVPVEVPFECHAQTINHDSAAEITVRSSDESRLLEPESNHNLSIDRINEHGPPLYKINSAYLI